ncbi:MULTISPECIES: hypothetical protein [Myxococcus]|uniref:hypothetical protein n=1 Tax=Myxococcus TaxID=32 RepID=UPI0013D1DE50|nr:MULTISPECIES: hypothetical protein [Myxococcus]NVJ28567.1 hypothetical protein [Myxococcus sp. AM011]
MKLRHHIGALLAVGVLSGCGVTTEEEQPSDANQVSALDPCDGTMLWEYNFYSDAAHREQVGGIICKCRGTIATWGDTSTPYVGYYSGACPAQPET